MSEPRLILHPGMGKTATTTLQQSAFCGHSEILYIGKAARSKNQKGEKIPNGYTRQPYYELFAPMLRQKKEVADPDKVRGVLQEQFEAQPNKTLALMSWEGLVAKNPKNFKAGLKNLLGVGYPLSVVFTIRNIVDWLPSSYLQFVGGHFKKGTFNQFGGYFDVPLYLSFESWLKAKQRHRWAGPIPPIFDNMRIAIDLLGRKNVEIVCFETLKSNPEDFFNQISNFLEINRDEFIQLARGYHANPRITEAQLEFVKQLDRSVIKHLRWRFGSRRALAKKFNSLRDENSKNAVVSCSQEVVGELAPLLRKEYAWLAETTGRDVEAMGYSVA